MTQIRFTDFGAHVRKDPSAPWVPYYDDKALAGALDIAVKDSVAMTKEALWRKSLLDQMALALDATDTARKRFAQDLRQILDDNDSCCQTRECLIASIEDHIKQLKGGACCG